MTATDTATEKLDTLCMDTIRTLSMDAVQKANSGHPGTPMALAPLGIRPLHAGHAPQPLRPGVARPRPVHPVGRARMLLLYSMLHLTGYP